MFRSLLQQASRNKGWWLAVTAVFGWAAWERFSLPQTPFTDGDVWCYVQPGLLTLLGEDFRPFKGQCFLYPWFVYLELLVGGDFRWVAAIQHLLGLGTGAMLLGCWSQPRAMLPTPRIPAPVSGLLGVVLAGVYLLNTETIAFEGDLRPESVFPFFVVAQILCSLAFIRRRFLAVPPQDGWIYGAAAVFLSVATSLIKPSFSFGLLLANLPVLVSLFRSEASRRSKVLLIGVPTCLALLLLVWPEWHLRQKDPRGKLFLIQSLFSIHADLVNEQMADDLAHNRAIPYPRDFLATAHETLSRTLAEAREEGQKGTQPWTVLGFDANYIHQATHPFGEWLSGQMRQPEKIAFYHYYYWRTVRERPAEMLAKVGRHLHVFYRLGWCPAYTADWSRELAEDYRRSTRLLATSPYLPRYAPGAALIERTKALETTTARSGPFPLTAAINRALAALYLPSCLGVIALVASTLYFAPWHRFRAAALVTLFLYGYPFGTVLSLAIGHSLDIVRYSQYQLAYTLLGEAAALCLAVELVMAAWNASSSHQGRHDQNSNTNAAAAATVAAPAQRARAESVS